VSQPDRSTTAGTRYLDLRKAASVARRPTDELLQLYALEGFLDRLNTSRHRTSFVLKGGFLLPAFTERRPTRDLDLSGQAIRNEVPFLVGVVNEVLSIALDDGLQFDPAETRGDTIRELDAYSGVRISVLGSLASAVLAFHVDINVGDPIWPAPTSVDLPRVLGGEPIRVSGYPAEMIVAEKLVTAVQRGTANTRWRDFVDIARLSETTIDIEVLTESIRRVAGHRGATLRPLSEALAGYGPIAQQRWAAWRRRQRLEATTPELFDDLLAPALLLADRCFVDHGNMGNYPDDRLSGGA
jgi:hypothetical protein